MLEGVISMHASLCSALVLKGCNFIAPLVVIRQLFIVQFFHLKKKNRSFQDFCHILIQFCATCSAGYELIQQPMTINGKSSICIFSMANLDSSCKYFFQKCLLTFSKTTICDPKKNRW